MGFEPSSGSPRSVFESCRLVDNIRRIVIVLTSNTSYMLESIPMTEQND